MLELSIDKKIQQSLRAYDLGLAGLADQHIQKAIIMGANAAAAKAGTRTKKIIAKAMKVQQKVLKDKIKVIKAKSSGKMPLKGASIRIVAKGRRIRLIYWSKGEKLSKRKGRITGSKGIKANAWGKARLYPGTFIAPIKYKGGDGIAKSTAGIFKRTTRKSLPIEQLYGPGVGREAERHEGEIMEYYAAEAKIIIPKKLDYQIRKHLAKG